MLKLSRKDFAALAWDEYAYDTVEVEVELYGEEDEVDKNDVGVGEKRWWMEDSNSKSAPKRKTVTCLAFKSAPCAIDERDNGASWRPSDRYKRLLQVGAQDARLDSGYQKWLESVQAANSGF